MKFFQFIDLVYTKVFLNLKSEAANSYLSYIWWLLEPLLHLLVFYLVFGIFLDRGTDNYVAFLMTGLIPWLWFSKSVSNSTRSIIAGKGLMMQVNIPKLFFPTVVVFQDFVKQSVAFTLLVVFLLLYGIKPTMTWIGVLLLIPVQLSLIMACSYIVSAITPFLPDFRYLVSTAIQLLMFGSGIFYSYDRILPEHQELFFLNPMATLIKNYRDVLLYDKWPDVAALSSIFVFSILLIMGCMIFFKAKGHIYPRLVNS